MGKGFSLQNIILITMAIIFLHSNSLKAAWWDINKDAVPLPSDSQEVKRETRQVSPGSVSDFVYYTSQQDATWLKVFFRTRLPQKGWQERDLAKELQQAQPAGSNMDTSIVDNLAQNLVFKRDKDMLIINFLPPELIHDGKTRFTIAAIKEQTSPSENKEGEFIPSLLTKPKKTIIPVYPGAVLTNLDEQKSGQLATYFVKDDIEDVLSFFKNHMPDSGWDLVNESPAQKIDLGKVSQADIFRVCPTCPRDITVPSSASEAWTAELQFGNNKASSCDVFIFETVTPTAQEQQVLKRTTIVVHYEEKKG